MEFLGMTGNEWIMLGIIIFVIYSQLATKMTTDVVYLIAMLAIMLTGLMDSTEVFNGLITPATLFMLFMFVIVECMHQTGALQWLMKHLLGKHMNMTTTLSRLTLISSVMSAFICNPSVGQIMYESVAQWGRRFHLKPSKLLLPVAYLIAIGGTCTVIAYPVNLLLISLLEHSTGQHYSIFVTLPGGIVCTVVCIIAILLLQRFLPDCKNPNDALAATEEYIVEMMIPSNSQYVGKTVHEAGLDKLGCGQIVRIVHFDRDSISPVAPDSFLFGGDRLVFTGDVTELLKLRNDMGFVSSTHHVSSVEEIKGKSEVYKVSITTRNENIGRSISQTSFEKRNNVVLVALLREGERIDKLPRETALRAGDTLLLEGNWHDITTHTDQYIIHNDWITGKLGWRGSLSVLMMLLTIAAATIGILPLADATFLTAILLCCIGCCTRKQAWASINWSIIVMLTGAFALGVAMKTSGLAATLSEVIGSMCGGSMLQTVIVLTISAILMTQVLFDATVVPVLAPIALESAAQLGIDPLPLVMAVLLGSACNFTTQISTAHMMMVYPLGGYRLKDLIRFGLPFCFIMAITIVAAVMMLY